MGYTKVDSAGNTLRDDAALSYKRMLSAGLPAGGIDVFTRTLEEQRRLYNLYKAGKGNLAAYPNANAPHIKGVAMDAQTTRNGRYTPSPAHVWLSAGAVGSANPSANEYAQANDFGWYRTVSNERWHWQYNPLKDKAKSLKKGTEARFATKIIQAKLGIKIDGLFGSGTETAVKKFQKARGLVDDGVVGTKTWVELAKPAAVTAEPLVSNGKLVVDGKFEASTIRRLQEFVGSGVDGVANPNTWKRVGVWLNLGESYDKLSRQHTQKLQTVLGMPVASRDGVWWVASKNEWGVETTKALQTFLNQAPQTTWRAITKVGIVASMQPDNQGAGGGEGIEDSEHYWMHQLTKQKYELLRTVPGLEVFWHDGYGKDVNGDGTISYKDNVAFMEQIEALHGPLDLWDSNHSNASGDSCVLWYTGSDESASVESARIGNKLIEVMNRTNIMPAGDVWTHNTRQVDELVKPKARVRLITEFHRHDTEDGAAFLRAGIKDWSIAVWAVNCLLEAIGNEHRVEAPAVPAPTESELDARIRMIAREEIENYAKQTRA